MSERVDSMMESKTKSERLKDIILADIRDGAYGEAMAVPSVRELCKRYGVCKYTASQAMTSLRELGLVNMTHGKKSKISVRAAKKIIHALIPLPENEYWSDVFIGMERAFAASSEYECQFSTVSAGRGLEGFASTLNPVTSRAVVLVSILNTEKLEFIKGTGLPFVLACQKSSDPAVHYVSADIAEPMRQIVRRFKERGRGRLAFMGRTIEQEGIDYDKCRLFKAEVAAAGLALDERLVADSRFNYDEAYAVAMRLFKSPERPDAVFASSDSMCLPIYRAARDCGLRVPEDISVAGCDNFASDRFMSPALSTIDVFREEQGRLAVESVLKLVGGELVPRAQEIKAEIVLRESI